MDVSTFFALAVMHGAGGTAASGISAADSSAAAEPAGIVALRTLLERDLRREAELRGEYFVAQPLELVEQTVRFVFDELAVIRPLRFRFEYTEAEEVYFTCVNDCFVVHLTVSFNKEFDSGLQAVMKVYEGKVHYLSASGDYDEVMSELDILLCD